MKQYQYNYFLKDGKSKPRKFGVRVKVIEAIMHDLGYSQHGEMSRNWQTYEMTRVDGKTWKVAGKFRRTKHMLTGFDFEELHEIGILAVNRTTGVRRIWAVEARRKLLDMTTMSGSPL